MTTLIRFFDSPFKFRINNHHPFANERTWFACLFLPVFLIISNGRNVSYYSLTMMLLTFSDCLFLLPLLAPFLLLANPCAAVDSAPSWQDHRHQHSMDDDKEHERMAASLLLTDVSSQQHHSHLRHQEDGTSLAPVEVARGAERRQQQRRRRMDEYQDMVMDILTNNGLFQAMEFYLQKGIML